MELERNESHPHRNSTGSRRRAAGENSSLTKAHVCFILPRLHPLSCSCNDLSWTPVMNSERIDGKDQQGDGGQDGYSRSREAESTTGG